MYAWTLFGKFPGMNWTGSWKTHPLKFYEILENSSDRKFQNFEAYHRPISGKLIQNEILENSSNSQLQNFGRITGRFLENSSMRKSFGLDEKWSGWVYQKSVWLMTRKTEFSEHFMDEFTRICQAYQLDVRNSWRSTWIIDQVDFIEYILQSSINMTLPVYYMYLQSRGTKYFHTCTLNAT